VDADADDYDICSLKSLRDQVLREAGDLEVLRRRPDPRDLRLQRDARAADHHLAEVRGQSLARQALELAAAGGHSLLLAGPPGTVLPGPSDQCLVATGQGVLRILQVQLPGGKRISAEDFLHSHADLPGLQLGV
jgi:hypothetical protein